MNLNRIISGLFFAVLSLSFAGCSLFDDIKNSDKEENPFPEDIEITVGSAAQVYTGLDTLKLVRWNFQGDIPNDNVLRDYSPDHWIIGHCKPSENPSSQKLTAPQLTLTFNSCGEPRTVSGVLSGEDAAGNHCETRISITQQPAQWNGKPMKITLSSLIPLDTDVDIFAPDIDFEKNPLTLQFENGVSVRPVSVEGHTATVHIQGKNGFQSKMKLMIGTSVYDFGSVRVYPFLREGDLERLPMTEEVLNRIDLGNAAFLTVENSDRGRKLTAYDEKLESVPVSFYASSGQKLSYSTHEMNGLYPVNRDYYFGVAARYVYWNEEPESLLQSAFSYDDKTCTIKLNDCYRVDEYPFLLRRSSGEVFPIEKKSDNPTALYDMKYAGNTSRGDLFYVQTNEKSISSLTVPPTGQSIGRELKLTELDNIRTAEIGYEWMAVNGEILLNRNQFWEKGYIKNVVWGERFHTLKNIPSYYNGKILSVRLNTEAERQQNGVMAYRQNLVVMDLENSICYGEEYWVDHGTRSSCNFMTFSYPDRTLLLPTVESGKMPFSPRAYVLSAESSRTVELTAEQVAVYNRPDLILLVNQSPYYDEYAYFLDGPTCKVCRMKLQPLGQLEPVGTLPLPENEVNLQTGLTEKCLAVYSMYQGILDVTLFPKQGSPVSKRLKSGEDNSYWYSYNAL